MKGPTFQEKGDKYTEMGTNKRPEETWRCLSAGQNGQLLPCCLLGGNLLFACQIALGRRAGDIAGTT